MASLCPLQQELQGSECIQLLASAAWSTETPLCCGQNAGREISCGSGTGRRAESSLRAPADISSPQDALQQRLVQQDAAVLQLKQELLRANMDKEELHNQNVSPAAAVVVLWGLLAAAEISGSWDSEQTAKGLCTAQAAHSLLASCEAADS